MSPAISTFLKHIFLRGFSIIMHRQNFVALQSMHTFLRAIFSDSCWVSFAAVLEASISCFFKESLSIPACCCHLLRSSSRVFISACSLCQDSVCVETQHHRDIDHLSRKQPAQCRLRHIYQFNFKGFCYWYVIITVTLNIIHCCSLKNPHNFES